MHQFLRSPMFLAVAAALVLMVGFQNCSNTHFTSELDGAVLKAEAMPQDPSAREEGDDGQTTVPAGEEVPETVPPGDEPSVGDPIVYNPPTLPPADDKKGGSTTNGQSQGSPGETTGHGDPTADLVECQMLHPNKKIVLSYDLEVRHGNSSSVRVCMSQNACLNLINAYASQNSCSLVLGEPNAEGSGQQQCTEIFPGSKGTCKNATIVSDEQITELLQKMTAPE